MTPTTRAPCKRSPGRTSGSWSRPWSLPRPLTSSGAASALRRRPPSSSGLASLDVEGPSSEDLVRMAELVEQYADFPLGGTDASVVALAERLNAPTVITLDRRHFGAVRPRHRQAFELLP